MRIPPKLTDHRVRWSVPLLLCAAALAQNNRGAIRLRVDATDAPRRLFHVHMTMPAKPGPMTLLYPEWIPGEHGPTGPIVNLVKDIKKNEILVSPWHAMKFNR